MQAPLTRRVKIVTGFRCNLNCMFCYYKDRLLEPNLPLEKIKKDIDFALRHGIQEIDFSGGEPTTHAHLPELIRYARDKGCRNVCIITNGIILANKEYYRNLVDAGLTETLFSLQGYDEQSHDSFVNMDGSFRRLLEGIENAASLGVTIRTNTVVHKKNYKGLLDIGKSILPYRPSQVNFIAVNDWQFAGCLIEDFLCSYSQMSAALKEACDFLSVSISNINVRYIPFCQMRGYEKYVCDHKQVKYDPYEWLPHIRVFLEKHYHWYHTCGLIGLGCLSSSALKHLMKTHMADFLDECIISAIQRYGYRKSAECRLCRYVHLCDGVERSYAKNIGLDELKRVEGEKITLPYHFRTHLFGEDEN